MLLQALTFLLDELVPPALSESWDNVGFQVGDPHQEITKALVVVDVTKATLQEALDHKVDLILSHHPVIFHPLKSVIHHEKGDLVYRLIQKNISVYVAHTNLDVSIGGVADALANALGLTKTTPLVSSPSNTEIYFTIEISTSREQILDLIFEKIKKENILKDFQKKTCSKSLSYRGKIANLSLGSFKNLLGIYHENMTIFPIKSKSKEGLGRIGMLPKSIDGQMLIDLIKEKLAIQHLRFAGSLQKKIKKIALLPGSGGGYLSKALAKSADAFITGDLNHHTALDAQESDLLVIDPGHYPSESLLIPQWAKMIRMICPDVTILESQLSTDPFRFQ